MRYDVLFAAAICSITVAACGSAPRQPVPEPVAADTQAAPPPVSQAMLPANTHIAVALNETLSPGTSRIGDTFTVTVVEPIIAQNGATVIPEGTVVTGMVTGAAAADDTGNPAAIRLNFLRMDLTGVNQPLTAVVIRTELHEPDEEAGAEGPPPRGAIVTGDLRASMIAGTFGWGAGTIVSLGTGEDPSLPEGTRLTIRTLDRLDLRR